MATVGRKKGTSTAKAAGTGKLKLDELKTEEAVEEVAEKTEVEVKADDVEKAPRKTAGRKSAKTEKGKPGRKPAKTDKAEGDSSKTASKKTEVSRRKSAVSVDMEIQFDGRSYTREDIEKIANDVWVYDLEKKPSELKEVSLYVKPEESKVYYVFNKDITGSFDI